MKQVAAAVIIDARGMVTGWSEGARRLTGHPAETAVGRPAAELLAEPLPPTALTEPTGVVALRHRDGHRVELAVAACPVQGEDGGTRGFLVTALPEPAVPEPTAAAQGTSPVERAVRQSSLSMAAFDTDQRFLWLNAAACDELGIEEQSLVGRFYADRNIVPDDRISHGFLLNLREVVRTGLPTRHEIVGKGADDGREYAWSLEMWPVRDDLGVVTSVGIAAFDSSDQYWARRRLALLNEAATAIGTTLDVVHTAEELVELAVPRFADFVSVDLLDWVLGADEPPTAPAEEIMLRRIAHGSGTEGTPEAVIPLGAKDPYPPSSPPVRAMMEGRALLGRVGERAFDEWVAERDAREPVGRPYRKGVHSMVTVPLRARGTTLGVAVLLRITRPDPYTAADVVLAEELASRAAVCVDNARRFARERTTALALQHSLLPRGLPGQAAVEIAHRYLPCGSVAGIGGDWFDVIPLSGSRVALCVGDVVGHGIQSSATMGRLRTAVRTLADVDLPPDELLTHLDDLVTHLADEEDGDDIAELGATCLYAVYDPVSRRLTLASAGHPPPALVPPGGVPELIEVAAGPPLGVGGLPFEATELKLPEGSLLALYTDGLIEDRDRDIDHATAELCRALDLPGASLDAVCDAVLKAVLPEQPGDDVALLLARTHALGAGRVATWDVPQDPAHVTVARRAAMEQLADWGLEEEAFVTELVVSELVTNAIRYGEPPIRLRLIRDRALIVEVSDGSSTSPHLRRAHAYDEGGRGLLLVAQLTQRWGSRQTGTGKTIWAEQPLPSE